MRISSYIRSVFETDPSEYQGHPRIVIEDAPPGVVHGQGMQMVSDAAGTCELSDGPIRLWADDSAPLDEIIDVVCHEHLHYLLAQCVDEDASRDLDLLVDNDFEQMIHN